jgi:putative cardiolipin synthase
MGSFGRFWLISLFRIVQVFSAAACEAQLSEHAIEFLGSNEQALSARLALIESAQEQIEISTYHIESGESTTAILDALKSAARRDVRVRLLFDGLNMELSSCEINSLQAEGIAIREFHPKDSGGLLKLNRRMHTKLLMIDGKFLIVGSRNLRDKHFGLDSDKYVDFELVLRGNVATEAVRYFDWIWNSCHVGNATGKQKIELSEKDTCADQVAAICPIGPFEFRPQFDAFVCCLYDAQINKSSKRMQDQRIEWVNAARHSLIIETPYPAFSRASQKAIETAAKRGVRVQIFTNSSSSNDQPLTWAALQNLRRRFLKLGVEIYEFQGQDTMHAKMFLVDGQSAVLGSHNFDARSDNFNLEFCIRVESTDLVQQLQTRLECRRMESRRITNKNPARGMAITDRAKTRIRQLTAMLIRPLL